MRISAPIGSLLLAVGAMAACTAQSPRQATLGHYVVELDAALDMSERADTAHHVEVAAMHDLAGVQALEGDHFDLMVQHMDEVDDAWHSMDACDDAMDELADPLAFDLGPMAETDAELRTELETHRDAMLAATYLAWAHDEEERHAEAMGELFDHMHAHASDLQEAGNFDQVTCPMHSPMHGMHGS